MDIYRQLNQQIQANINLMNQLSQQQREKAERDPTLYSTSESSSSSNEYNWHRCRRIDRHRVEISECQQADYPGLPGPMGADPSSRGGNLPMRTEIQAGAAAADLNDEVQLNVDQLHPRNDDQVNLRAIHRKMLNQEGVKRPVDIDWIIYVR